MSSSRTAVTGNKKLRTGVKPQASQPSLVRVLTTRTADVPSRLLIITIPGELSSLFQRTFFFVGNWLQMRKYVLLQFRQMKPSKHGEGLKPDSCSRQSEAITDDVGVENPCKWKWRVCEYKCPSLETEWQTATSKWQGLKGHECPHKKLENLSQNTGKLYVYNKMIGPDLVDFWDFLAVGDQLTAKQSLGAIF